jgi:uncharacterized protein (TIGR02145 family)
MPLKHAISLRGDIFVASTIARLKRALNAVLGQSRFSRKSLFYNNISHSSKGVGMNFFIRKERALLMAVVVVAVAVCVSSVVAQGATGAGTFTDERDGKTYKTVKLGGKTWMGENLNYQASGGSWCYGNDNSKCNQYGRLYDWNTAKTACPDGWHLPSRREWGDLAKAVGGTGYYGDEGTAGAKLKSASGWDNKGNGKDEFGFSALPGGSRAINGGFNNAGNRGLWWTAVEFDRDSAYYRRMGNNYAYVYEGNFGKGAGFYVRCLEGAALSCGGKQYDEEQYFCHKGELVKRCGFCYNKDDMNDYKIIGIANSGNVYNPETQFCASTCFEVCAPDDCGDEEQVFENCGGKTYAAGYNQFCHDGNILNLCNPGAYREYCEWCEGKIGRYDPVKEFCHNDLMVADKCSGKTYNAEMQFCDDNKIKDNECGGKKYNMTKQFCHNGNLYNFCGDGWNRSSNKYDPGTQRCKDGAVENK